MQEVFLTGDKYSTLIGDAPLEWSRLPDYPLILHPKYTYTRQRFDNKMKDMGIPITASIEMPNTNVILQMAAEDFGLAMVTKEIAQMNPIYDKLREIQMSTPYEGRDTFVAWRKDRKVSKYMQKLIECIITKGLNASS
jgi:DNA-binding transcriptional LysR family regulator